ncbi:MAG TPA: arylsulfatase [Verrucomicrobiae bacterium]|nr:arylsulfatase [Verrucomicrobiae bacterium]
MKFTALLPLALCGFITPSLQAADLPARPRPNILIILADDMGFSDIGCYGGEIATPNLDALAAGGLRFTQFYNSARCCPTRASLLTGLHPHQAGIGHMMGDRGHDGYRGNLNRRCVTLAEALKPAGYQCYAVGKWHVTPGQTAKALNNTQNWPLQRGFDRFYGTIHGAGSYFDPSSLVRDNALITPANDPQYPSAGFYYTDAIADHAVRFIREHSRQQGTQPFFLYTAFTAAHWPLHAKDSDIAKYKGRYDQGYEPIRAARQAKLKRLGLLADRWTASGPAEKWDDVKNKPFESRCMEVYAAQIDCMDQGIGRIIAELKTQGQFDNTLIFYLQDNGGCAELIGRGTNFAARPEKPPFDPMGRDDQQFDSTPKQTRDGWPVRQGIGVMPGGPDTYIAYGRGWANVSNTPFREYKHWTHEGGISTPFIVHWPNGITNYPGALNPAAFGRLITEPGQLVDIMATCLDVASTTYPAVHRGESITPPEGRSLAPLWSARPSSNTNTPHFLYWEHEGNRAVRSGDWKLVARENKPWELYHLGRDRTEMNDLASSEPARVAELAGRWDAWAARAGVLPLGTWRDKSANTNLSSEPRFVLKAGDHLDRSEAPAIVLRAFRVTAKFSAGPADSGVIVAQGGTAHGYSLFIRDGHLHFTVRSKGVVADSRIVVSAKGNHQASAGLDSKGALSLRLDEISAPAVPTRVIITVMPTDGLDVGSDGGGAVGPYQAPARFSGTIESVVVGLESGE